MHFKLQVFNKCKLNLYLEYKNSYPRQQKTSGFSQIKVRLLSGTYPYARSGLDLAKSSLPGLIKRLEKKNIHKKNTKEKIIL